MFINLTSLPDPYNLIHTPTLTKSIVTKVKDVPFTSNGKCMDLYISLATKNNEEFSYNFSKELMKNLKDNDLLDKILIGDLSYENLVTIYFIYKKLLNKYGFKGAEYSDYGFLVPLLMVSIHIRDIEFITDMLEKNPSAFYITLYIFGMSFHNTAEVETVDMFRYIVRNFKEILEEKGLYEDVIEGIIYSANNLFSSDDEVNYLKYMLCTIYSPEDNPIELLYKYVINNENVLYHILEFLREGEVSIDGAIPFLEDLNFSKESAKAINDLAYALASAYKYKNVKYIVNMFYSKFGLPEQEKDIDIIEEYIKSVLITNILTSDNFLHRFLNYHPIYGRPFVKLSDFKYIPKALLMIRENRAKKILENITSYFVAHSNKINSNLIKDTVEKFFMDDLLENIYKMYDLDDLLKEVRVKILEDCL